MTATLAVEQAPRLARAIAAAVRARSASHLV